jgi:ELWxxDGT repeat protein
LPPRRPAHSARPRRAGRLIVANLAALVACAFAAASTKAQSGPAPLACGVSTVQTLESGAVHSFVLPVASGEAMLVEAVDVSGQIGLLRLRAVNSSGTAESCSGSLEITGSAGATLLEVSDCLGEDSGDYAITANVVSDSRGNCARSFSCGLTPSALRVAGAVLAYAFEATAGEQVTLAVTELGNTMRAARLRVFAPDGSLLSDACGGTLAFDPPAHGLFTTVVSSCTRPETGRFTLRRESAGCPAGPLITFFGLARSDDTPLLPDEFDAAGRPVYLRPLGHGFSVIVEAQPGRNGRSPGAVAFEHDPGSPSALPDVQLLLGRPIGFGTPFVCDASGPRQGGVPGAPALSFDGTQETANLINDFGCRFNDGSGSPRGRNRADDACTRAPVTRDFAFVNSSTTMQFCAQIAATWAFQPGDTIAKVRVRDNGGNYGPESELVVRVSGSSSFLLREVAPQELTPTHRFVYFSASDAEHGAELWRSDGTREGTQLFRDLVPGPAGSFPTNLTAVGDEVFYVTEMPAGVLWHSSGRVPDISVSRTTPAPPALTKVGGKVFFFVDRSNGLELWRSDTKSDRARFVQTVSTRAVQVGAAVAVGSRLFFTLVHSAATGGGTELWRSSGSADGTEMVEAFTGGGEEVALGELTAVGNLLYFVAGGPRSGFTLWRTDGTAAGTVAVRYFAPAPGPPPTHLVNVAGSLFFTATDAANGTELWRSNGSETGTRLVADIRPGPEGSNPNGLTALGGRLLFAANDGQHGMELWRSDGSAAGTRMVKDIRPGSAGSNPSSLANVNGTLLFAADEGTLGSELWQSDGTETGTVLALDIEPGPLGGAPDEFTVLRPTDGSRGAVLFRARYGSRGTGLWAVPYIGRIQIGGCPGDCDGDSVVSIAELVRVFSSAIEGRGARSCTQADTDQNGIVTVDEIMGALQAALEGCS